MDTNDNYTLDIDVPGVRPEDIEVSTEAYSLASRVIVKAKRGSITYSNSYLVPKRYDADQISANVYLGVLTLTLPVKVDAKPRKVLVTASPG